MNNNNELKIKYFEKCNQISHLLEKRFRIFKRMDEIRNDSETIEDTEQDTDIKRCQKHLEKVNSKLTNTERELEEMIKTMEPDLAMAPFDKLAKEYNLCKEEKYIIIALFFQGVRGENRFRNATISCRDLLALLGYYPWQFIDKIQLIKNLIQHQLINYRRPFDGNNIFDYEFYLASKALSQIIDETNWLAEDTENNTEQSDSIIKTAPKNKILIIRAPLLSFDQIVLDDEQRHVIEQAIFQMEKGHTLLSEWGFDQTIKYGKGLTMLFYGPPGTGKTATAEAIAQRLNKKIGIANYSQILDKWFGNAEKRIVKVFDEAKRFNCVLVFDEADALFGQRLNESHATDRTYNYMTNVLMQEIEQFDGLVILTTNRELAMDPAFERRILFKIKFDVPKAEERAKIWRTLIPPNAPISDDVDFNELGRRFRLTGGEIKNIIIKVVFECCFSGLEKITMDMLVRFANKELASIKRESSKAIGF
ncbi:MAG: ATP-binding protein [candidate division WOR-3 bacterium]